MMAVLCVSVQVVTIVPTNHRKEVKKHMRADSWHILVVTKPKKNARAPRAQKHHQTGSIG